MNYENMSYEEILQIKSAEADRRSLKWDEYFCYATVFLAIFPLIANFIMIVSDIEILREFGVELYPSISFYVFLYPYILGIIHFFHLITRLGQDNSKGAWYSVMAIVFLIFFRFGSTYLSLL